MLASISFFFLLFFSTFFSIVFSYFILEEEEENNLNIILYSILGTSVAFIVNQASDGNHSFSYGISIFSVLYLSTVFFNDLNKNQRILFVFPGIIGLMIGFGLIFNSILLMCFLYIAKNNFNYLYTSKKLDSENNKNEENK